MLWPGYHEEGSVPVEAHAVKGHNARVRERAERGHLAVERLGLGRVRRLDLMRRRHHMTREDDNAIIALCPGVVAMESRMSCRWDAQRYLTTFLAAMTLPMYLPQKINPAPAANESEGNLFNGGYTANRHELTRE